MACNRLQILDDSLCADLRLMCPVQHLHAWSHPSDTGIELSQITVIYLRIRNTTDAVAAVFDEKRFDGLQYLDDYSAPVSLN